MHEAERMAEAAADNNMQRYILIMRKDGILQILRAYLFRSDTKRQSGLVVFSLSAPYAYQLRDVREHLRYWPFIKAFKPMDETHMKVLVYVGKGITEEKWDYYLKRSCELMNQCVRQHQAIFVENRSYSSHSFMQYHHNGFLRPDDLLKPFSDFIDEIN